MYQKTAFPTIDMKRTGQRIATLRRERGLSVRDLQDYFGFEYPQAIYKWQWGETLPSVDNLFALARILRVNMEDLLVEYDREVRQKAPSEWKEPLSYAFFTGAIPENLHAQSGLLRCGGNIPCHLHGNIPADDHPLVAEIFQFRPGVPVSPASQEHSGNIIVSCGEFFQHNHIAMLFPAVRKGAGGVPVQSGDEAQGLHFSLQMPCAIRGQFPNGDRGILHFSECQDGVPGIEFQQVTQGSGAGGLAAAGFPVQKQQRGNGGLAGFQAGIDFAAMGAFDDAAFLPGSEHPATGRVGAFLFHGCSSFRFFYHFTFFAGFRHTSGTNPIFSHH